MNAKLLAPEHVGKSRRRKSESRAIISRCAASEHHLCGAERREDLRGEEVISQHQASDLERFQVKGGKPRVNQGRSELSIMLSTFASRPNAPSSTQTTSSWQRHSLEDGSWPSGEQTSPSTLPIAASSPLKSACGPPRSCGGLDDWWLTQLLAGVPQGQQWLGRCECAVP